MSVARPISFASIALFPLALLVACGGSNAAAPGAASPANSPGSASPSGAAAATPASTDPGAPTTTTATLPSQVPDGGELQGAKLQEKSTSGAATFDVDAGPSRGAHTPEPGRSQKDIQTIIMAHRDEARACYDRVQQQKGDPIMKGNLDVTWKIDPNGNVTDVGVDDAKSDIHDKDIAACIQAIIKGIHFSVSGKGFETRAHYPFNFNPHAPPPKQQH